jgi:hypothetical protein
LTLAAFAFGLGEELRDDLVSEMSWPAADGGSFDAGGAGDMPRDPGVEVPDVDGFCTATGLSERAKALDLSAFALELPAM